MYISPTVFPPDSTGTIYVFLPAIFVFSGDPVDASLLSTYWSAIFCASVFEISFLFWFSLVGDLLIKDGSFRDWLLFKDSTLLGLFLNISQGFKFQDAWFSFKATP